MVEYKENNKYAYFNNNKFTRDDKTGYYLSSLINGKRYRLHRYVWEYYNGIIPKGYDIHHKDHNKNNNEIENLELLLKEEHIKRHKKEISEETKNKYRENINKARIKAIKWHKSKAGSLWHKKQYEISLGKRKKELFVCEYCGKEFECIKNGTNRFCSNKCKSAYRRKTGIDDIERNCVVCGKVFIVNKYSKKVKCDNCKRKKVI